MKSTLKHVFRRFGFDVSRYRPDTHHGARFRNLLRSACVGQVFDVGANEGQYAAILRSEYSYSGDIISFEPLPGVYERLVARAAKDSLGRWRVSPRVALGSESKLSVINVAGNSVSSSLFTMAPLHRQAHPGSKTLSAVEVPVRRLDDMVVELGVSVDAKTLIKIDTQGFEIEVLKGASKTIAEAGIIQLEMSLSPLYTGQPLFSEVFHYVTACGFEPFDLIPGFADPRSGRLLQVDGIFTHREAP